MLADASEQLQLDVMNTIRELLSNNRQNQREVRCSLTRPPPLTSPLAHSAARDLGLAQQGRV